MSDHNAYMQSKECVCCGKRFCVYDGWAYKHRTGNCYKYCCSWHCLLEYRKQLDALKLSKKHRTGEEKICASSLKRIRLFFGLRQSDVAEWVGVCKQEISHVEQGLSLSSKLAKLLANGFGCTVNDIIAEEFDPNKAKKWNCVIKRVD